MKLSSQPVSLAKRCSIQQYLDMVERQDSEAISNFVKQRFVERYLDPIESNSSTKNGFTMMAVCCLMVEALESFSLGWKDSKRKSAQAFRSFFTRWSQFAEFQPISDEFYEHVRCGILHQAETTGGWRVRRSGALLNGTIVNAAAFSRNLRQVLHEYAEQLRTQPWDTEVCQNFRKKMSYVCENAKGAQ